MPLDATAESIQQRFHDLLISYDFARRQRMIALGEYEEDDYVNDARRLLDVEKNARESRQAQEFSKAVHKQEMSSEVNSEVDLLFRERILETDSVVERTIGTSDAVPASLDILSVKAASISRLEPLVASQQWLTEDLIKFVNLPVYRKSAEAKKVRVDKLKTALSYIGLENLPFVIPSFALRQWVPHSTEPFRLMKRKLWENGLATAICCRKLAQIYDQNESALFVAGMFHDIGKSAIIRLYYRVFDEVWKKKLTEARDGRMKEEHDALVDLEPDPIKLRNLMMEFSAPISANIVESFNLKRMMVLPLIEDYASDVSFDEYSEATKLLSKGIAYARYKMLQRHNLISKQEAKAFFAVNQISTQEIIELRKLSLKRLNLNIASY
ncbi:hypothetical protein C2869_03305 [Saccharobesus litoralis]|uniref:HDOD domain-containing protein n=1 Tax=Saccharobesus litoralis TaxID=2172099 RepID=A0A2S0VN58_9ALTE|nr:HDOD domain-containing protein [Saccharobesus litoralis]AWB65520.1 hypothetical protein C2869_03305 [Saccharobesus litoralis]